MAGGIVPRYDIPQGVPLPPRYAVAEPDRTLPAVLHEVSRSSLVVSANMAEIAERRERVAAETELAKRKMMIETDDDTAQNDIRGDRTLHKNAVKAYDETMQGHTEKWLKDLDPKLHAVVAEYATRKAILGRRNMRGVQDKFLQDDFAVTADNYERVKIDRAGRTNLTDEEAFDGVVPRRMPVYVTEEPSSVAIKSDYRRSLDAAIESGAITADKAGDRERALLDAMAYRRVQRLAISEDSAEVQKALDLLDEDEKSPGSNFVRYMKAEHKNALRAAAVGRKKAIKDHEIADEDRADRKHKEESKRIADEQKRADRVEIGDLVLGVLRGQKGTEDFNKLLVTNATLMEDVERQKDIQLLIDQRGKAGGTTNWELYNQLWREVVQTRGAAQITFRVAAVAGKPNGLAREDAEKLLTWANTQGERSIFKDDYYQAGQRDIDRVFSAGIGVMDEGKARRYAEASRELADTSRVLIERGEREKIPTVVRQISDRWIQQAPDLTVKSPRDIPRYTTTEELVNAYIQQYGLPEKWAPATTAEFNRQARILRDLQPKTPQTTQPQSAPKPKPQQPNPIQ